MALKRIQKVSCKKKKATGKSKRRPTKGSKTRGQPTLNKSLRERRGRSFACTNEYPVSPSLQRMALFDMISDVQGELSFVLYCLF